MPDFAGTPHPAVQADGKIVLGGYFNWLGGLSRNYIGRLNANGSVDTSFNPGADNGVFTLAIQADGKILAGGDFWHLGGQARTNLGRLNATGSVDTCSIPRRMAKSILCWYNLTERFWSAEVSPCWAARPAPTSAGSMRMAAGTPPSTQTCLRIAWPSRPTGKFWWADASPPSAVRREPISRDSTPMAAWIPPSIRASTVPAATWSV